MQLNSECRDLLDNLYGLKGEPKVSLILSFHNNDFKSVLSDLSNMKAIQNLYIEAKTDNGFIANTKISFLIRFDVVSWKKIDDYGEEKFNDFTVEPYGDEKQKRIVKDIIIEKALELENTKFKISSYNFKSDDIKHIAFLKILDKLEEEKFIKTKEVFFEVGSQRLWPFFEADIEILESYESLKKVNNAIEKIFGKREKKENNDFTQQVPRFYYNQGILHRDFCKEVLIIKGENTQEYRLLDIAFNLPINERIDALTDGVEMKWRQVYDTARRLNEKIKETFKVDNFFEIDFENKKLCRTVE